MLCIQLFQFNSSQMGIECGIALQSFGTLWIPNQITPKDSSALSSALLIWWSSMPPVSWTTVPLCRNHRHFPSACAWVQWLKGEKAKKNNALCVWNKKQQTEPKSACLARCLRGRQLFCKAFCFLRLLVLVLERQPTRGRRGSLDKRAFYLISSIQKRALAVRYRV